MSDMSQTAIRHGWTRHGHPIPYVPQYLTGRPSVRRCGGPRMCLTCRQDVDERVRVLGLTNVIPTGTTLDLNEAVADHITRSIREVARDAMQQGLTPDWRFAKFEVEDTRAGLIGRWSVPAYPNENKEQ